VTVLRHTAPPFAAEQAEQLSALGIPVIDGLVVQVEAIPGGPSLPSAEDVRCMHE
jgi:hypothetical protein